MTRKPLVPDALPVADALRASQPLAHLQQRLQASNARLAVVRTLLPAPLAPHVFAGPLDETGWTLLVANAGIAAKLRQLAPRLERGLTDAGHGDLPLRIKVRGR